jgi:hypothetical protein
MVNPVMVADQEAAANLQAKRLRALAAIERQVGSGTVSDLNLEAYSNIINAMDASELEAFSVYMDQINKEMPTFGSGSTTDQKFDTYKDIMESGAPLDAIGSGSTSDAEVQAYQDAISGAESANQDLYGSSVDPLTGATRGPMENIGASPLNPGASRGEIDTAIAAEEQNRRNMEALAVPPTDPSSNAYFQTLMGERAAQDQGLGYMYGDPSGFLLNIGRKSRGQ